MRKQFVSTFESLIKKDKKLSLLLCDIGVFGFRNSIAKYPNRVMNIGILEQSTIGVAAGMSRSGLIPVIHTIAPFLVERAFEQIKIDFGYQDIGCNLVSVGASYDYASLGCTHHCPADVALLKNIPVTQPNLTLFLGKFIKMVSPHILDSAKNLIQKVMKLNLEKQI